jgi:hypothetical protein
MSRQQPQKRKEPEAPAVAPAPIGACLPNCNGFDVLCLIVSSSLQRLQLMMMSLRSDLVRKNVVSHKRSSSYISHFFGHSRFLDDDDDDDVGDIVTNNLVLCQFDKVCSPLALWKSADADCPCQLPNR